MLKYVEKLISFFLKILFKKLFLEKIVNKFKDVFLGELLCLKSY